MKQRYHQYTESHRPAQESNCHSAADNCQDSTSAGFSELTNTDSRTV